MKKYSLDRFQKGDQSWQHKKCCQLLKCIYQHLIDNDQLQISPLLKIYNDYADILDMTPIECSFEWISNRFHEHLAKTGRGLKEHNLLPTITQYDVDSQVQSLTIDIYLDHLRSAHNVGSIMRTNEALRLGHLWRSIQVPWANHISVQKTSMGTHSFIQDDGVCTDISQLKRPLIGLETVESAESIFNFAFPSQFTLIVGNEEYGISSSMKDEVDIWLKIPMYGSKNSLNVANAFAITAYEIVKQQRSN